jgi:LuxR family maltose regulon positive regulatory protein
MREFCAYWAANSYRTAGVSLDAGDNDPARFAAYLMATFVRALPEIFSEGGWTTNSLESTVIHVINRLMESGYPCALILDDYHLITA